MHIAAVHKTDALILGAFGCGAFANDPDVVSRAYRDVLVEYKKYFRYIEFAVYCRASLLQKLQQAVGENQFLPDTLGRN